MNSPSQISQNEELVIVSFFITRSEALAALREQWARRDREHKQTNIERDEHYNPVSSTTFGGAVSLLNALDLQSGFMAEVNCPVATGMAYGRKQLLVGSNKWIRKIKRGQIIGDIGHTLFNDVHALEWSLDGQLLVTSTGVDGILKIDLEDSGKLMWDWLATENGYNSKPAGGVRVIDRSLNYQEISTTTPEHTTHINSAIEYEPCKILATLFHQGELVEINCETKKVRTLLTGLKCPHAIRKTNSGFVVSDTLNNRALLLNTDFQIVKSFQGGFDWVQDTIQLENGDFLLADSNNTRIVRLNEDGEIIDILQMERDTRKIFGFLKIDRTAADNIFSF